jgi:hypothetical protein
VFASVLLIAAIACRTEAQSGSWASFDGHWWVRASQEEREGFVTGFVDCYKFEVKGAAPFERSTVAYRDLVSDYYGQNASRLTEPVTSVLPALGARPGDEAPAGGETWPEPHGFYDGRYWVQVWAVGGANQQLGFVEGYLACNHALAQNRNGVFSKPADAYRALISQWYQFDPRTGNTNTERDKEKIADVLRRFRDGG